MKKTVISRLTLFACCVALVAWTTAAPATGQSAGESLKSSGQDDDAAESAEHRRSKQSQRISVRPVLNFSDQTVVPAAGTMLARTRDGAFMTLNTSGLAAGTAVTAWWGIFNNPRACATRPCTPADLFSNPEVHGSIVNAAGRIIGADGAASYGDFIAVGDTTGALIGPGLLEPLKAEIHLVTRTHGPAFTGDPDVLRQQLSMFNGGCPPNTCANLQVSIHQP